MMKKNIITILAFIFILTSCATTSNCKGCVEGKLIDNTALDGCGWLIELENGKWLNPININEYNIEKSNGLTVSFKYEEVNNVATICMSGKTVNLTFISPK